MCGLPGTRVGEAELSGAQRERRLRVLAHRPDPVLSRPLASVRRCSHCPGGRCPCRHVTYPTCNRYTYGSEVRIYCGGDPTSAVFLSSDWHCLRCGDKVT